MKDGDEGFRGSVAVLTIGTVQVSASVYEDHEIEADVTDHPVEEGSDITDNYRVKPRVLMVEAVVSDVFLEGAQQREPIEILRTNPSNNPSIKAWQDIEAYFEKSQIVSIRTSLKTYPNMLLTMFRCRRSKETKNAIRFTLRGKTVRFAKLDTAEAIEIPNPKDRALKGKNPKAKGKKGNKEADSAKAEKARSSLLSKLLSGR